jgi:hypothetical protein
MANDKLYLFRRSNGVWYVIRERGGHLKWKSTRCRTKSEALRPLREQTSRTIPAEIPPKPLKEFLSEFLKFAMSVYRKKTLEVHKRTSAHLLGICPSISLQGVTGKVWDDYAMKRSVHVSDASLAMEQQALKSMMSRAVTRGLLPVSPFAKSKVAKPPERPPKYFTREEFDRLVSSYPRMSIHSIFNRQ